MIKYNWEKINSETKGDSTSILTIIRESLLVEKTTPINILGSRSSVIVFC